MNEIYQGNKEISQTQENTTVTIQRLTFFIRIAYSMCLSNWAYHFC